VYRKASLKTTWKCRLLILIFVVLFVFLTRVFWIPLIGRSLVCREDVAPSDAILVENFDPNYRGKGLQLEFTVEDQGVFTMPWSATITYGRSTRTAWEERICAENVQHDYEGHYYSDKDAHLPTADKPDF